MTANRAPGDAAPAGVEDPETQRNGVQDAARQVAQAQLAVKSLLERVRALEAEVDLMAAGVAALGRATATEPEPEARPSSANAAAEPEREPEPEPNAEPPDADAGTGLASADLDAAAEQLGAGAPSQDESPGHDATGDDDRSGVERARLLALNMALGGIPRADAERRLRAELDIDDPDEILADAYGEAG